MHEVCSQCWIDSGGESRSRDLIKFRLPHSQKK